MTALSETTVLFFAAGHRLRHDAIRREWVLLGPERLFQLDEHAIEVLRLIDGARGTGAIIDDLATRFEGPRAEIATDVMALLDDLIERGALRT